MKKLFMMVVCVTVSLVGYAIIVNAQSNVSELTGFKTQYSTVPNGVLTNSSTTVNGQTCTLGSSCTVTAQPSTSFGIYPAFTQVVDGNFSWANQQTASYSVTNGIVYLTVPQLSGANVCAREAAAPMSTPWSITIAVLASVANTSNSGVGIEVRDSVGGHFEGMQLESAATGIAFSSVLQSMSGASLTSWSHNSSNNVHSTTGGLYYFKVLNNGTNLLFYGSADGVLFSLNQTRPVSGFANTPNKVGFFVQSENSPANVNLAVLSWVQGTT